MVVGRRGLEHAVRYHKVRDQLLTRNDTVRTIYTCGNAHRNVKIFSRVFFQTLFLGLGTTSRIGVFGGVHPATDQGRANNGFFGYRAVVHVPVPRQVPERKTPERNGNIIGPQFGIGQRSEENSDIEFRVVDTQNVRTRNVFGRYAEQVHQIIFRQIQRLVVCMRWWYSFYYCK